MYQAFSTFMQLIFVLSKENIPLAAAEVLRLYKPKTYLLDKHLLLITTVKSTFCDRLAYTQEVYERLFLVKSYNIIRKIEQYNWNFLSRKAFAVRLRSCNSKIHEKDIAHLIWKNVKHPKVDLRNPEVLIGVFSFSMSSNSIITKRIWENKKDFLQRKAHLRPELHPSSLHPRLARAMINLTGKAKGVIVDPFCGSGGILIEALFLGFTVVGVDNDQEMLERAEKNIAYYKFSRSSYKLLHQSALAYQKKCAVVITDLPYGKNTKAVDHEKLYNCFLQHYAGLAKTMVVGFPDFVDIKMLVKKTRWNIKYSFTYYLHKSLSKRICVLEE